MDEQRETLYIPTNIKTRQEFFNGFGFPELMQTLVIAAISFMIAMILYAENQNVSGAVLIVIISIAATVVCVSKDRNNQSMLDYVKNMIRFSREQREYPYFRREDKYSIYEHI
jgi:type IV secretory pathway VirB3-like protein